MNTSFIQLLKQSYYFMMNNLRLSFGLFLSNLVISIIRINLQSFKELNSQVVPYGEIILLFLAQTLLSAFTILCVDKISRGELTINGLLGDLITKAPRYLLCEIIMSLPIAVALMLYFSSFMVAKTGQIQSLFFILLLIYSFYLFIRLRLLSIHSICSNKPLTQVFKLVWTLSKPKPKLLLITSFVGITLILPLLVNSLLIFAPLISIVINSILFLYLNIFSYRFYIELMKNETTT